MLGLGVEQLGCVKLTVFVGKAPGVQIRVLSFRTFFGVEFSELTRKKAANMVSKTPGPGQDF